jgi:hypothetical protein
VAVTTLQLLAQAAQQLAVRAAQVVITSPHQVLVLVAAAVEKAQLGLMVSLLVLVTAELVQVFIHLGA